VEPSLAICEDNDRYSKAIAHGEGGERRGGRRRRRNRRRRRKEEEEG